MWNCWISRYTGVAEKVILCNPCSTTNPELEDWRAGGRCTAFWELNSSLLLCRVCIAICYSKPRQCMWLRGLGTLETLVKVILIPPQEDEPECSCRLGSRNPPAPVVLYQASCGVTVCLRMCHIGTPHQDDLKVVSGGGDCLNAHSWALTFHPWVRWPGLGIWTGNAVPGSRTITF